MRLNTRKRLSGIAIAMLVLAACGNESGTEESPTTAAATGAEGSVTTAGSETATPDTAGAGTDASWPEEFNTLVFPTGSQGGGGYSWGTVAGQLWAEELGLQVEVQAGGGQSNIPLIEEGQVQLAATSPLDFAEIFGEPPDAENTEIRDFWTLYPLALHTIVPEDSSATMLSDLAGTDEPIAIGAPDSSENQWFRSTIECGGYTIGDFNIQELGKDEASAAYSDGLIAGWSAAGPAPMPQFAEVMVTNRGGKFLGIDQEMIDCMLDQNVGWAEGEIGEEYELSENVKTLTLWYPIVVHESVPDALVYEMARVIDERYDDLVAAYAGARYSTAENTAQMPGFGLHPGVEQYLRDSGELD
ncbi:MAG: TAXI family TRAP transporter solute-binding subunit [Acidimicrobiia bacterium]|nr:TAXI family TRAP transporter solute-binding subunit [Acidimicrobiia bacterium]